MINVIYLEKVVPDRLHDGVK